MQLSRNAATTGSLQGAVEEAQLISWPTPGKVRATLAGSQGSRLHSHAAAQQQPAGTKAEWRTCCRRVHDGMAAPERHLRVTGRM